MGFDREGILWVLTETRGEAGKQLFYLPPDSRQFRKAGDNLVVESFTWDADHTVLTTHDRSTQEPASGVELESSLPAYPILKKDSAQILDRANGIWFVPRVEPGIWRHPAGESMAEIVSQASHNNSQVYDITPYRFAFLVDREGSVWIGDQKGVHRFSYSPLMELALPTNVDALRSWCLKKAESCGSVLATGTDRRIFIVWQVEKSSCGNLKGASRISHTGQEIRHCGSVAKAGCGIWLTAL